LSANQVLANRTVQPFSRSFVKKSKTNAAFIRQKRRRHFITPKSPMIFRFSRNSMFILATVVLCACATNKNRTEYPLSQASKRPQTVTTTDTALSNSSSHASDKVQTIAAHLIGGTLVRADNETLVVLPTNSHTELQQVGLTTDAIITSALLAKINTQPHLRDSGFEVSSNSGTVTIHARQPSIDDAVTVLNLALAISDVRKIVYLLPTSA
jgi:hypothetical protein